MRSRQILIVVALCLWVSAGLADTVILKDKREFTGKVIRMTETEVQIETKEGASLTFLRDKVEKIDKPAPPPKPSADTPPPAPSGPATLDGLQKEVAALRAAVDAMHQEHQRLVKDLKDIKEIKEKLENLSDKVSDMGTRASRLPPKRGDFAGATDRSKFKFTKCTIERGGDEYKIHGYIKNVGSSPGVWLRIINEVRDENGNLLTKNDINPVFNPSGSHEARDKSVLSPGEEFEFDTYVPYGKWASSRDNMGIRLDVAPPGAPLPDVIVDTVRLDLTRKLDEGKYCLLKIEVPPKEYAGQKGGTARGPGARK